jgi:outer membrane protein OmpA-like peptidoglycan-associated protein
MKRYIILLILLKTLNIAAVGQESKKITIKGIVRDQKSKMPLAAQIKIIYIDSQFSTQETTARADGSFEIHALPQKMVLQAKSTAYIVSNILMNLENLSMPTLIAEIPLVFIGKPKVNQLIMEFAAQKKEIEDKSPKNKQFFQAIDALNGSNISAQFRLIDANRKELISKETTLEVPIFEHNFAKKESILLEVTANGYQKFLGNISIENFDETVHENTAKLIKNISFINLSIKNEAEIQNLNVFEWNNTTQEPVKLAKNSGIYFGMLQTGTNYKVQIKTKLGKEITKEFVAIEGLTQLIMDLELKENKPKIAISSQIIQPEKQAFKPEIKSINLEPKTIFFEQSSSVLNQESKMLLEQISKKMIESPDVKIEITGHTDNIGDIRQNLYLSEFRAKVISSFLFNKGIKDSRILLKGDGSTQPNVGNDTEENRQKNRRAELRFY